MKEKQQEQEVEKLDPNNHLAPLAIAEQQQQLKPFQPPLDTQQQGCITFWTKNSNKHDQVLLTTVPT